MAFADELDKDEIGVVERQNKLLGRKLDWITIRDNLIRDGIVVNRTAALIGDSEYQVRNYEELLIFKTLDELQDYYMSVVTSTPLEPEIRYDKLNFDLMKEGFKSKNIRLKEQDTAGFYDLVYPHLGVYCCFVF